MPADPGAGLKSAPKGTATTPKDIGHVAPSFEKEHVVYNTLVIRPEYRISLRLGDIDKLFPWPIDTKAGRLARMQVLGLFYWPISHRIAAGKQAKPAGARIAANQSGYIAAWTYFKEKFCGVAKATLDANPEAENDKGEAELKKRLKEWIVQRGNGGSYGSGGEGELPLPAPEDKDGKPQPDQTKGHFAKLRMPGGWRYSEGATHDPNIDPSMAGKGIEMAMYKSVYALEKKCHEVNKVGGKIPLVAKVEKRDPSTDEWKPAKNMYVYFQLLKPYDLPAFDTARRAQQQLNHPPLIGSVYSVTNPTLPHHNAGQNQKWFQEEWDKYQYDANSENPQVNNCHKDCGGKRKTGNQEDGSDVKDIIFQTGKVAGFSDEHVDPPADILDDGKGKRVLDPKPSLKEVEEVTDTKYPHSVKAKTNDAGEAGVIFLPSRCGGDRYRFRAFLGPDTFKGPGSDGTGLQAVRADTGTLVIWRNLRLSRFLRQTMTGWAALKDKMVNQHKRRADNAALGANDKRDWSKRFGATSAANAWVGLPDLDFDTISDGKWKTTTRTGSDEDGIRIAMAKAFCELETDPGFVANEAMTQADWNAAVLCGLEDLKQVGQVRYADLNRYDYEVMLYRDAPNADINNVNCCFIFPARNVFAYAAAGGRGHARLSTGPNRNRNRKTVGAGFKAYLYAGFMRHITRNGVLPGLTIIQGPALTNLESERGYSLGLFGIGTQFGPFVMRGQASYATKIGNLPSTGYGYTACVVHEVGHCLFKVHAPGRTPDVNPPAGTRENRHDSNGNLTAVAPTHDTATPPNPRGDPKHGTCVMSYRDCEGFMCSRCLMQLRGWNILGNTIKNDTRHP